MGGRIMSDSVDTTTSYQLFPDLDADKFAALREDVARNGVTNPVDVDEHGTILDGHHRSRIADELGIACPTRTVEGLSERDKLVYAARVNALRRGHLSADERRPAVARLYVDAEQTQQAIADVLGVSVQTVSNDLAVSNVGNLDPSRGGRPRTGKVGPKSQYRLDALVRAAEEGIGKDGQDLDADTIASARQAKEQFDRGELAVSTAFNRIAESAGYSDVGWNGGKGRRAADSEANRRSHASVEQRYAEITDLAGQGYRASQIAAQLGLSERYVRQLANDHNITLPDAAMGKSRAIDPHHVVEQTVLGLANEATALGMVDLGHPRDFVSPFEAAEWAASLTQSLRSLTTLRNQLKEAARVTA